MKIKIIDHTDKDFDKRIKEINELYNAAAELPERVKFNEPSTVRIVYVKGHRGGIICDYSFPQYPKVLMINMAAFEKVNHRKGFLTACMRELDKQIAGLGHEIGGVFLNPFDNECVWQKFGFSQRGTVNMTITMCRRDQKELFNKHTIHTGGIPINQDFLAMLASLRS